MRAETAATRADIIVLQTETKAQSAVLETQNVKLDKLVQNADDNAEERGRRVERDAQKLEEQKLAAIERDEKRKIRQEQLDARDRAAERALKREQSKGPRYAFYGVFATAAFSALAALVIHSC